jgi:hypothetical protein
MLRTGSVVREGQSLGAAFFENISAMASANSTHLHQEWLGLISECNCFVMDSSLSEMTRLGNNVPTANPRLRL